jgi:hypothetical protein
MVHVVPQLHSAMLWSMLHFMRQPLAMWHPALHALSVVSATCAHLVASAVQPARPGHDPPVPPDEELELEVELGPPVPPSP